MDRTNQDSKRFSKVCIILVLSLCAWQSLYAAIVLETPQTEVKVFVTDRFEERKALPPASLLLPLCSIAIKAKHTGKGYLKISHTALYNEFETVPYELYCENTEGIFPDILDYTCNPYLPLTIPLTELSVILSSPLSSDRSSYSSEVSLHLKLEV